LAKGKTIDKALKIEKDDIVKKLGGLPSVKYHCSILAVDALVEAIYDYFVKNNIKITADLQQKHEKIQKAKNIIEERYKKWA
jgi:nitrogen fixation NifU-like protein